jgi:hypothetical protein
MEIKNFIKFFFELEGVKDYFGFLPETKSVIDFLKLHSYYFLSLWGEDEGEGGS